MNTAHQSNKVVPRRPFSAFCFFLCAFLKWSVVHRPVVSFLLSAFCFQLFAADPQVPPPSAVTAAPETSAFPPTTTTPVANAATTNGTNLVSTQMDALDDKHKLGSGDRLSFRIMEDQVDSNEPLEPKGLVVADTGDLEVPYLGRFPAAGRSCKQLAQEVKAALEKEYYYQATVIIAVELRAKSAGKVYVVGQVRQTGPVDMPGDEQLTLSKAVLRAGGFTDYADKRHVKVTRKVDAEIGASKNFTVDLSAVLEEGKTDKDLLLEPGDTIFVASRLFKF
jgi:protein involved in polysaccharide export with SLBB domain